MHPPTLESNPPAPFASFVERDERLEHRTVALRFGGNAFTRIEIPYLANFRQALL